MKMLRRRSEHCTYFRMSHPSASFLIFYNYAEGVIILLMAVVGISGNCITASIMTSQSLSLDFNTTFRHILLMLATFDSLFLILALLTFSMPLLSDYWDVWIDPILQPWLVPAMLFALNGSKWSIVMVAIERFVSICYPR